MKIVNLGTRYGLGIRIDILQKAAELAFTCTKLTIETPEKHVKHVQSQQ